LLAAQIIGTFDRTVRQAVDEFRSTQTQTILDNPDPSVP
jgi:5-(carboxyamino)imidazole ribonucleotide mutase